ncbi:TPA: hypothetical protein QHK07_000166 [Klebsiella aerogenes]|nr:hypothetical protein [Klebsiella aerogenes]
MNHTLSDSQLEEMIKSAVNSSGPLPPDEKFSQLISALRELQERRKADSEPVIIVGDDIGDALSYRRLLQTFAPGTKLYRHAQPAPVVPEEMPEHTGPREFGRPQAYVDGWNACRAAMLQGAENSESRCGIQAAPVLDSFIKNADARCGNSPVIPDGYVMVPKEPTEEMIVNGFESEPDESLSDEKDWKEYDAMSGCQQAAHRAKLCWGAMIAAAPKL